MDFPWESLFVVFGFGVGVVLFVFAPYIFPGLIGAVIRLIRYIFNGKDDDV